MIRAFEWTLFFGFEPLDLEDNGIQSFFLLAFVFSAVFLAECACGVRWVMGGRRSILAMRGCKLHR